MPQSIRGRSFIRSWIYAITLITGSVIAAALIIDPYGISPLNLSIPGINETRTERTSIDRLIKPVEVMLRQPRTVILGTSRVKQGLDPSVFQGTPDWPAYNLGMDFSGPAETILFMEKLLPRIDALKKVFIEININHFYFIRPPVVDLSWSALAGKVIKMVFTLDALKAAARTIVRNRSYEGHPWWLRQDGVTGHVPDRFLNQDVPNFLANVLPGWNAEYSLGNNQAKALDRIAALCRDNGW